MKENSELYTLLFIFVFATIMLALYPQREEMSRWIENGAVIAILARAFGTDKTPPKDKPPETKE